MEIKYNKPDTLVWPEKPDNVPIIAQGPHTYRLRRNWVYEDKKYKFIGFIGWLYDGASVPGLGTFLTGLHADGLLRGPCVPHDMLYENSGYVTAVKPHPHFEIICKKGRDKISKSEADRLFYRMMRQAGISRRLAIKAYLAVRYGGQYPDDRVNHNEQSRYNA